MRGFVAIIHFTSRRKVLWVHAGFISLSQDRSATESEPSQRSIL